jgi:CBS domain-containing protein
MNVRDVMTSNPILLDHHATVQEAARQMRDAGVGDVLIHENGELRGIVTDRDIVVRVIADQKSPEATELGDCCSQDLHTLSPDQDADEAVQMMREYSVRRIPVVEDGQAVGIVTMGDLAMKRDEKSALADVSSKPPNN